jgi:hypothetical protein
MVGFLVKASTGQTMYALVQDLMLSSLGLENDVAESPCNAALGKEGGHPVRQSIGTMVLLGGHLGGVCLLTRAR